MRWIIAGMLAALIAIAMGGASQLPPLIGGPAAPGDGWVVEYDFSIGGVGAIMDGTATAGETLVFDVGAIGSSGLDVAVTATDASGNAPGGFGGPLEMVITDAQGGGTQTLTASSNSNPYTFVVTAGDLSAAGGVSWTFGVYDSGATLPATSTTSYYSYAAAQSIAAGNYLQADTQDASAQRIIEQPTVVISLNFNGGETSGNPVTFTVGRNGDINVPFEAKHTVQASSTAQGVVACPTPSGPGTQDYETPSGTARMPAGLGTATVQLVVCDDTDPEPTETVGLSLAANPSYIVSGTSGAAVGNIIDNELPEATIESTTDAPEMGGTLTYEVQRTGDTAAAMTISYKIQGGQAAEGVDFVCLDGSPSAPCATPGTTSGLVTVNVPAGASTANIDITVLDDVIQEGAEDLQLILEPGGFPPLYTVGTPGAGTANILDDDTAGITVTPTTALVTDESGKVARLDMVLDTQPQGVVTITFGTSDTTEAQAPATISFDQTNWMTSQTVSVVGRAGDSPVIQDDGDVAYQISPSASSSDAFYNGILMSKIDLVNEDIDTALIGVTDVTGVEPAVDGTMEIMVTLNMESVSDIEVDVSFPIQSAAPGVAGTGLDYDAVDQSVTISRGLKEAKFTFNVLADMIHEDDETVAVQLDGFTILSPGDGVDAAIDDATGTATIQPDGDVPVVIVESSADGDEGDLAPPTDGIFILRRSNTEFLNALTVYYDIDPTSADAATPGLDYTALPGSVVMAVDEETTEITVAVREDTIEERQQTVKLDLDYGPGTYNGNGLPGSASKTLQIADDEDVPDISIVKAQDGQEPSTDGQYTITRSTEAPDYDLDVDIEAVGGKATEGIDYDALPRSIRIGSGSYWAPLEIIVRDDTVEEASETVVIQPIARESPKPGGYTTSGPATLVIKDDGDLPVVSIEAIGDAFEGGADGSVRITRENTEDLSQELTVLIATTGTAIPDDQPVTAPTPHDYEALPSVVTIKAGSTSVDLPVVALQDTMEEPDQTVVVTIDPSGPYQVAPANAATLNIVADDDLPVVGMDMVVDGYEGYDDVTLADLPPTDGSVRLYRITEKATYDLTVDWDVSGTARSDAVPPTATQPADYESIGTSGTIPDGQTMTTVIVKVLDDWIEERAQTVVIDLDLGNPAYTGTVDKATIQIHDDLDLPRVYIETIDDTASENNGDGTDNGEMRLTRITQDTTKPLEVHYTAPFENIRQTAIPIEDYEPISQPTKPLIIPATKTNINIPITVIDDQIEEPDQTLQINIDYTPGTYAPDPNNPEPAKLTIKADDDLPLLEITTPDNEASEQGPQSGTYEITRHSQMPDYDLKINAEVSGDATPGADYQAITFPKTIKTGATTIQIPLVVYDDTVDEFDQVVTITLQPGAYVLPTDDQRRQATIPILDDDPLAKVSIDDLELPEEDGFATFTVSLEGATEKTVTLDYTTKARTADPETEFTPQSGSLTFKPGQKERAVKVPIFGDDIDEPDEYFDVILTNQKNAAMQKSSGRALIIDDDLPELRIATTPDDAPESQPVLGQFVIDRVNSDNAQQLHVLLTITGTAGEDDYVLSNDQLFFDYDQDTIELDIFGFDDLLSEQDETIIVCMQPGDYETDESCATFTILDNDLSIVALRVIQDEAIENQQDAIIQLQRTTDTPQQSLDVFIDVTGGTAEVGKDYMDMSGPFTIPAGAYAIDIPIKITNDHVAEPQELVELSLQASFNYNRHAFDNTALFTIDDDDIADLIATPNNPPLRVSETGDTAAINLQLATEPSSDVTVDVISTNPVKFYIAKGDQFTFTPQDWNQSREILVKAYDNTLQDGSVHSNIRFKIVKALSSADYIAVDQKMEPIIILDDDFTVSVTPGFPEIDEGTSTAITIQRDYADPGAALDVHLEIGGSATPGIDYQAIPIKATIPSGEQQIQLELNAYQDNTPNEGPETIQIKILPGPRYQAAPPTEAAVQINDLNRGAGPANPEGNGRPDDLDACTDDAQHTGCTITITPDEIGDDEDADGVPDTLDNCRIDPNPAHNVAGKTLDLDGDGKADAADLDLDGRPDDTNGDGKPDITPPTWQSDMDADGKGDPCDPDADGDQLIDQSPYPYVTTDNCDTYYNPEQTDEDQDGTGDPCDNDFNFATKNPSQASSPLGTPQQAEPKETFKTTLTEGITIMGVIALVLGGGVALVVAQALRRRRS